VCVCVCVCVFVCVCMCVFVFTSTSHDHAVCPSCPMTTPACVCVKERKSESEGVRAIGGHIAEAAPHAGSWCIRCMCAWILCMRVYMSYCVCVCTCHLLSCLSLSLSWLHVVYVCVDIRV